MDIPCPRFSRQVASQAPLHPTLLWSFILKPSASIPRGVLPNMGGKTSLLFPYYHKSIRSNSEGFRVWHSLRKAACRYPSYIWRGNYGGHAFDTEFGSAGMMFTCHARSEFLFPIGNRRCSLNRVCDLARIRTYVVCLINAQTPFMS